VSVYAVLTRGSLDERKWELLRKKGAASDLALDGQLIGEQEKPIDWSKVLRQMRAAGVRATGDELDEDDVHALWQRAEGAHAPPTPRGSVTPLAARLTAKASAGALEPASAESPNGQLAFDLAA
jgi:hypothetical protein